MIIESHLIGDYLENPPWCSSVTLSGRTSGVLFVKSWISKWIYTLMESTMSSTSDDNPELYHEKQSQELCALHAMNNLFQEKRKFMKKDLDAICSRYIF